jgi:signal transduction histidine kinase
MKIRTRLTIIFFLIVIIVLTSVSVTIYVLSANYRKQDFYRRLKNRAINTAKLLVEVEEVNADLLRRMEQNNPASLPNQYIVIYSYKNQILYSSDGQALIPVDTTLLNRIRLEKEVEFTTPGFEAIGFLFTSRFDRYTIVAAATDVYGLDALNNLRNVLLVTFIISTVLVSFLGWIFAGRVLSPIAKIVGEVSNITEENLDRRLNAGSNKDELSMLATTFNSMLERLQSAFTSQKSFIANASHEIKTPITVMSGEIEVTLLHDRDKQYYVKILRSVLQGLKGLNRLSNQLLLLAQTSADHPRKNLRSLRVDDILWELKEELQKLHPEYQIEIEFPDTISHDSLVITCDEQLLRAALMNLMENGCKYSDDKHVIINLQAQTPEIVLQFVNTGTGISPESIDRIFDPFVRATSDKRIKGFGIGLSLVKRIVQLHGGTIHVESTPHESTIFSLRLPTAVLR